MYFFNHLWSLHVESLIHFILLVHIHTVTVYILPIFLYVLYKLLYYILFFTIQHKLQYGQRLSAGVIKRTFLSHILKTNYTNLSNFWNLIILVSILNMIVVLVDQGDDVYRVRSYVYIMYNVSTLQIGKCWLIDKLCVLYFSLTVMIVILVSDNSITRIFSIFYFIVKL